MQLGLENILVVCGKPSPCTVTKCAEFTGAFEVKAPENNFVCVSW